MTGSELPVDFTTSLGADSADVDNDGDYDVMVANDSGQADHLLVNDSNIPDSSAPRVVLEQVAPADASSPVAVRAAVYDNASWDVMRYNATVLEYSVNGGPLESVPMLFAGGQSWRAEIPAGTTGNVTYTAVSSDDVGNTGVSATLAYSVEGVESYCTAGTSASGCQALLSASGTASASRRRGFTLSASTVEGQKDGLFFFGTNGQQANPWGNSTSFQCVVPPVVRTPPLDRHGTIGLCDGAFSLDLNAVWYPAPKPAKNPGAAAVVQAQLWYRDPLNTANNQNNEPVGRDRVCGGAVNGWAQEARGCVLTPTGSMGSRPTRGHFGDSSESCETLDGVRDVGASEERGWDDPAAGPCLDWSPYDEYAGAVSDSPAPPLRPRRAPWLPSTCSFRSFSPRSLGLPAPPRPSNPRISSRVGCVRLSSRPPTASCKTAKPVARPILPRRCAARSRPRMGYESRDGTPRGRGASSSSS